MTQEEATEKLRVFILTEFKTAKNYAKHIGFTASFVSAVLNGKREPTNYMLSDIGVKKTTTVNYNKTRKITDEHKT